MTNTRYRVRSGVMGRQVDGELLLLDRQADQVHKLNPMASYIWTRLDGATSTEDIVKHIVEEFAVDPDIAAQDVLKCTEQLRTLNLVETLTEIAEEKD